MEDLKAHHFDDATKVPTPLSTLAEQKWLFERRFQFAWSSFDFHAKQRTTVFNFFLIFAGIVASAYATLLKDGNHGVALAVALVAGLVSLAFVFLEHRNEELVHQTEDVLRELERDVLFDGFKRTIDAPHPRRRIWFFQWKDKQKVERQLGIHLREEVENDMFKESFYRHGRWFPLIEFSIALAFFAAAVFAATQLKAASEAPVERVRIADVTLACKRGGKLAECVVEAPPAAASTSGAGPAAVRGPVPPPAGGSGGGNPAGGSGGSK